MSDSNLAANDAPTSSKKTYQRAPIRQKFAAVDDVVLLRAVNAFQPWRTPVGTANGIMKVFEDVALHCGADPEFGLDKSGAALRTRFTTLVTKFKRDQCQSMRKSGTVEQFLERDSILLDTIERTTDWEDKVTAESKIKEAKQQAVESSGALIRRLTMNEMIDDESAEEDADSAESDRSCAISSEQTGRKRPGSAKKGKITKRERLAAVMDVLTDSIKSSGQEESSKYEFKAARLVFEEEQANMQRQHEAVQAEKRRQHELNLEQHKAEEEREKRMFEFIRTVLEQNKSKP